MKQTLASLIEGKTLTRQQTREIMTGITREEVNDCQIAAFLTALQMRGTTVEELLGLRDVLLETGVTIDLSPYRTIDIVGTGGDGKNTFNISTCSAFVIAGAGYKVSKHGNYGATSISGASDVIEAHGVRFTNNADQLKHSLEESGVAYFHAPLFARGMKSVAPIRKALQVPTCFNLLGPLVNPCKPAYSFLGVANLNLLCELTLPLVKVGGQFAAMKSVSTDEEIRQARSAIAQLGGCLTGVTDYTVPETDVVHRIVSIEKTQHTPKQFPRAFARIKKAPLV